MTTTAIVFLVCWAALIGVPRTPIARLLNRVMVEMPAALLNRREPGHFALAVFVTMLVVVHLNAGDGDPIRMAAVFAPEVTLWLSSIEIGIFAEAIVASAAAAAALRRLGIGGTLGRIFVAPQRHPKNTAKRARNRSKPDREAPSNDEDGAAFALAS